MTKPFNIEEARKIIDAATPGPWDEHTLIGVFTAFGTADETFIAYARTALPAACDEIERLRLAKQELQDQLDNMQTVTTT